MTEGLSQNACEAAVRALVVCANSDPDAEGLQRTPERYVNFLREFTTAPEVAYTTFDGEGYDEMIVQSDIPFYSLCEHHLVPFFGTGTIAYIPKSKIVGLSKLARTLEKFSRRLQNQERLTMQVATAISEVLQPKGVAVALRARHLCIEMRGVRKPGTFTTTSRLTGLFKDRLTTRSEFLTLMRN